MKVCLADIYWLAGLLEGEGCFGLSSGCLRISLNMTDKDVVERAAKLLQGPIRAHPPGKGSLGKKKVFTTEIFSKKAASWMMTLYPLMGIRRKETIEIGLSVWKKQRNKNPNGMGRKNPRCEAERKICVSC